MDEKDFSRIKDKLKELKIGESDLSRDEDLSIAIMNIISLEEHAYFTAMKTGNGKYLDFMNSFRELRKSLLKKIVKNPEGEEWCISKHLLAATMRLIETGTKEMKNDRKEAEEMFSAAFGLYSLFFAINLKLVNNDEIKLAEKKPFTGLSAIMKKIVDCCKE